MQGAEAWGKKAGGGLSGRAPTHGLEVQPLHSAPQGSPRDPCRHLFFWQRLLAAASLPYCAGAGRGVLLEGPRQVFSRSGRRRGWGPGIRWGIEARPEPPVGPGLREGTVPRPPRPQFSWVGRGQRSQGRPETGALLGLAGGGRVRRTLGLGAEVRGAHRCASSRKPCSAHACEAALPRCVLLAGPMPAGCRVLSVPSCLSLNRGSRSYRE